MPNCMKIDAQNTIKSANLRVLMEIVVQTTITSVKVLIGELDGTVRYRREYRRVERNKLGIIGGADFPIQRIINWTMSSK